ncbi:methyl-CpG-binding domain-containing protein 5-like [Cornus florida]|uniref:methyl-CpG-binding domain-containing protein 5-like n=1 Tax=Cornus florida TaxID=4283 RepID=UPI00289D9F13|nr:methyl-CpG-binding domain-containing protein 5-like [Cornus florida]
MSTTEPLGENRIPQSDNPNPPESHQNHADSISPDPLLQSGTFIDATVNPQEEQTPGRAQNGGVEHTESRQPEPLQSHHDEPVAGISNSANGVTAAPVAEKSPSSRRKNKVAEATAASALVPERPDWLPEDWTMQCTIRSSGATAGSIDKYYVEPVAGRRFRSKQEVLYFLETGSKRKRKLNPDADATSSESPGAPKQKKSGSKKKKKKPSAPPPNFDFDNVPEEVSWVLTDASSGTWSPYIGDEKVPQSTKQEWAAALEFVNA